MYVYISRCSHYSHMIRHLRPSRRELAERNPTDQLIGYQDIPLLAEPSISSHKHYNQVSLCQPQAYTDICKSGGKSVSNNAMTEKLQISIHGQVKHTNGNVQYTIMNCFRVVLSFYKNGQLLTKSFSEKRDKYICHGGKRFPVTCHC